MSEKNKLEKMDIIPNIAKETELKKYDEAYVVEDDMIWEVFDDGYSKAQVIWDKENICELLNNLHQENQKLQEKIIKVKQSNNHYYTEYYKIKEENDNCKNDYRELFSNYVALEEQNKQLQEKLKDANDEVEYWKDIVERYRSSANLDLEECTIIQGNKKYMGKVRKFVKYENHSNIDLYDLKEINGEEL